MQIVIIVVDTVISIHALLAESDPPSPPQGKSSIKFLSTLSLRRATGAAFLYFIPKIDFYPRSPCGERRRQRRRLGACICISIHALLAESDA